MEVNTTVEAKYARIFFIISFSLIIHVDKSHHASSFGLAHEFDNNDVVE